MTNGTRPTTPATPCARCACTEPCHIPASLQPWRLCQTPGCRCPGYTISVWCATCDVSPKWAGFGQCFGCLYDHIPPAEVVPRQVVSADAQTAAVEMRRFRQQWEVRYPAWELVSDREQRWPETPGARRQADTRKCYLVQWQVVRRHPRALRPQWAIGMPDTWTIPHTACVPVGIVSREEQAALRRKVCYG